MVIDLSKIEIRVSSQIQRVLRDGMPVYEKRYVTNEWDDDVNLVCNRAQREVNVLQLLADCQLFSRRLGIVRIADANPQEAAITTHEVMGINLGDFILHRNISSQTLRPWFLCGKWLQKFQTLPVTSETWGCRSKRDPDDIVEYCDLRLRSLAKYGYRWPNKVTHKRLLNKITDLNSQLTQELERKVLVHADFAPGNLMWGNGILTPIDFAMVQAGGPLDDATYLIHRLEMHCVYRPWRRLPVSLFRQAILRGLGRPDAAESPAYHLAMIRHLICRLHTYVRRPSRDFRQSVHDRWVRRVVRWRLQHAMAGQPATGHS